MKSIVLNCDYVQGYLRDGHFELDLTDEQYEEFSKLPKDEQIDYIKDCGSLEIDSYKVEDYETENDFEVSGLEESITLE